MKRLTLASALALGIFASATAWADVAPGPGPGPAPECTAARIARPGDQCLDCGASYEQPNKCQELASQGYRQACRAPGASVWNEVWCRGGGAPPEEKRRGCGSCTVGDERSTSIVALVLAALGAAALVTRRR